MASAGGESRLSFLNRFRFPSRRRHTQKLTTSTTTVRRAHRPATRMYSLDPCVKPTPGMLPKCRNLTVAPALKEMSEQETERIFEKMMDEMNLNEHLREPLRQRTFNDKRQMLVLHVAGANLADGDLTCVDDYLVKLSNPCLTPQSLLKLLESVRVALSSKPISWVANFSEYGMDYLLLTLSRYYYKRSGKQEQIILECVRCLRYIIASKIGVQYLLGADRAMDLLVKLLDPRYPDVMIETIKALSELCLADQPEGCKKVLSSMTINFDHGKIGRFAPLISGLTRRMDTLTVACLRMINCIMDTIGDNFLEAQVQDELVAAGFDAILNEARSSTHNPLIMDQIQWYCSEDKSIQRKTFIRSGTYTVK